MPSTDLKLLQEFVTYASRLTGDEKSEAHVFLEHLFQAFGHKSLAETGVVLERRVKRQGQGTKFADLVWPGHVLIEMKSRSERLDRHYRQVFDYWMYLTPNRPRWVLLCNFDEFWIYDFDAQVDEPMEKVALVDLPHQAAALAFLRVVPETPVFGINRVRVTEEAANRVAAVFNSMTARGVSPEQAQRFVLQCVVAQFSEDLGLLPLDFFTKLLSECLDHHDQRGQAFDMLGGLFRQMDNPEPARGGRFKEVRYFNGGLFGQVTPVEMTAAELRSLFEAAKADWSQVNPAIFGTIFQHSMGEKARHAHGAHYTSEVDILKVVVPTIVRPWRDRIESTKKLEDLLKLRQQLFEFRVLDPACGSGNFLYIAYRELKRVETDLIQKIRNTSKRGQKIKQGHLSIRQFFGFDTLPFAVELAKVTLLLAKQTAIAEAESEIASQGLEHWLDLDPALPLDNLDGNIVCSDALFTEWPRADVIIGNPPFQSKNKMQEEFGAPYVARLRKAFPAIPGRADYCVYFFRKAHDQLSVGGRAGLVGTNTIRENYSREGGLDYIVGTGGTITEAVSTQEWSVSG